MATITVLNATPNMLRLLVTGPSEGGETADITQAALIAACADGPLKTLLTSPLFEPAPGPGPSSWTNMHEDARLTTRLTPWGVGILAGTFSYIYRTVASVNELSISIADAGSVIVELQYENTLVR